MRLLKLAKRATLLVLVSAAVVIAVLSVYLRIGQYRYRRRAELLLSDVRELAVQKANATQVRLVIAKWHFEKWQGPDRPCTEDECVYRVQLMADSARDHFWGDPITSGLATRPLGWLGMRPSVVEAIVEVRGETLAGVSFSVYAAGRGCEVDGRVDCTLIGYVDTERAGSSWSAYEKPDAKLQQALSHPNYLTGTFPALFNADTGGSPVVVIWAELTRNASIAELSRLMQFDLRCLTQLRRCRDRDLMPSVWAQSVEDKRKLPQKLTCTPELSRRVAQLADVAAIIRPETAELSPPPYSGRPQQLRNARIVSLIKKPNYPHQIRRLHIDIDIENADMMLTADSQSVIRPGQEYVFLLQLRNNPDIEWIALYPCGVLTLNEANLAIAREAASLKEHSE